MDIKDLDKILERNSDLVDCEFPSDGRTCHMKNTPSRPIGYVPEDEAGQMYFEGMELLEKGDVQKGRKLLEEAYNAGNLEAGNSLAMGLSSGWFGERDYTAAVRILRKLSRKGERNAMNNYAFAYMDGLGVKKNLHWAEFWLIRAIEKGNLCAAATYGQLIIENVFPQRSKNLALWLLFWAADNGVSGAMNDIGLCYEEGTGMRIDHDKAFEWFNKSVEYGGGACAEFNVSRCYRYGLGVEEDDEKADAWLNLSIEHGFDIETYNKLYDLR